jgi:AcrR family transcriptional regulator
VTTPRKDSVRTRKSIVDAAEKLLIKDGRANFTEIAVKAGVSPATIYRYFSDRSQLLTSIMENQLTLLEAAVDSSTLDASSFERLLRLMAKEQAKYQGVIAEVRRGEVDSAEIETLTRRTYELFRDPLEMAKGAGAIRESVEATSVINLLAMIDGAIGGQTTRAAREKAGSEAVDILLEGIRGQ